MKFWNFLEFVLKNGKNFQPGSEVVEFRNFLEFYWKKTIDSYNYFKILSASKKIYLNSARWLSSQVDKQTEEQTTSKRLARKSIAIRKRSGRNPWHPAPETKSSILLLAPAASVSLFCILLAPIYKELRQFLHCCTREMSFATVRMFEDRTSPLLFPWFCSKILCFCKKRAIDMLKSKNVIFIFAKYYSIPRYSVVCSISRRLLYGRVY